MQIGILGTGRMGTRLAAMLTKAGHKVILGSRDSSRGPSYKEAASSPVVLPAMFLRDGMLDSLEPLRPLLKGKIWIDITNPFNADYSDFTYPWQTSASEEIQKAFPDARLVGAFKNVWWECFDAPTFGDTLSDVFVVGDDEAAKQTFLEMVKNTPFRYLNAGPLKNARTVERMTLLSGELGVRYGFFPRMNYKLLGEVKAA